jgi:DNA repair exonuclease SbcCD ATPase subunit
MIKLKTLIINNCLPFGKDVEIYLDRSTVTQLVGKNGTGKSSIPILLEEILYNKNSKGVLKGDLLNRFSGSDTYSLTLLFNVDNDKYKLQKTVKNTAKVYLEKNGKDISAHTATQTYKIIEDILGMDMTAFSKLVYQSILSSMNFLVDTDSNKKKFLVNLLNLSKYLNIEEEIKKSKKELETSISSLEASISQCTKSISKIQIPSIQAKIEVPDKLDFSEELLNLSKDKTNLTAKLKLLENNLINWKDNYNKLIADYNNNKLLYNTKVNTISKFKDKFLNSTILLANIKKLEEQLKETQRPDIEKLKVLKDYISTNSLEQVKKETRLDLLRKAFKELKDEVSITNCPRCGSPMDVAAKAKELYRIKDEYDLLLNEYNSIKQSIEEVTNNISILQQELNGYNTLEAKLKKTILEHEKLSEELSVLKLEMNNLGIPELYSANPTGNFNIEEPKKPEIESETDIKDLIDNIKLDISIISNKELKIRKEIQDRDSLIESIIKENISIEVNNSLRDSLLKQKQELNSELEDYKKDLEILNNKLNNKNILLKIFNNKGLIAYKLESSVKIFEDKVNYYLSELSEGVFALGFELEDNNLKANIYSSGKSVNIKTLSSGELVKVNISTLLAIRDLISVVSKSSINVLFLDEIISFVDVEGIEDLINTLLKLKELNIFMVSHNYVHPLVEVVKVIKENNISRVEYNG